MTHKIPPSPPPSQSISLPIPSPGRTVPAILMLVEARVVEPEFIGIVAVNGYRGW